MRGVRVEILLGPVPAVEDVGERGGGGSDAVERRGGDVDHLAEGDEAVEAVHHGGDLGGVRFGFDFEEDDVLDDLGRRGSGRGRHCDGGEGAS